MIRYIPEHKAFLLQGNDYSYIMYVARLISCSNCILALK